MGSFHPVIGRIPILDVQPVVAVAGRPDASSAAQSVPGEVFTVSATIFREGHEMLGAAVVLTDPDGNRGPLVQMRELGEGTDRYGAQVAADREGRWHFTIEAWGDPIARWRHDAGIKVPIGQDTELMLTEGTLLLQRAQPGRSPPPTACRPKRPARPGPPRRRWPRPRSYWPMPTCRRWRGWRPRAAKRCVRR